MLISLVQMNRSESCDKLLYVGDLLSNNCSQAKHGCLRLGLGPWRPCVQCGFPGIIWVYWKHKGGEPCPEPWGKKPFKKQGHITARKTTHGIDKKNGRCWKKKKSDKTPTKFDMAMTPENRL